MKGVYENHRIVSNIKEKSVIYLLFWKKITWNKLVKSWKSYIIVKKNKEREFKRISNERNRLLSGNSMGY